MQLDPARLGELMEEALLEARKAADCDEVPVGAVIAVENQIIARSHNLVETRALATAHAECLAMEQASRFLGNWRLSDCILCVTLEPCPMCMGAILLARIPIVVFGARDPRMGAAGSLYDLSAGETGIRVIGGIREEECSGILKSFFEGKREL